MTYFTRIAILTGAAMLPIIALFAWIIIQRVKKTNEENKVDRVIDDALNFRYATNANKSFDEKFTLFWSRLLKPAGLVSPISDDKRNAVILISINLIVFLITLLFTFNPLMAIIPPAMFTIGLYVYCASKVRSLKALLNEQIPSFLSSLKSNIQSNETPERALLSAITTTAEPLYSELEVVKSLIETGTFETALSALRNKTENEYLKFLCSCIELSNIVGANLEDQIVIIEKMITDKQDLNRKIDSAVAQNTPILYVAGVAIPFLFMFMYFTDASVRAFWFHSVLSWVAFFAVFVICGAGCWLGNKIIQGVRKM